MDLLFSTSYFRRFGNASSDGITFEWFRFSSNFFFWQWRTTRIVIRATMKNPPNEMPIIIAKLSFLSSSLVDTREIKYTGAWKLIEWTPFKPMLLNRDDWIRNELRRNWANIYEIILTPQGAFQSISEKMYKGILPGRWETSWLFTFTARVLYLNTGQPRINPLSVWLNFRASDLDCKTSTPAARPRCLLQEQVPSAGKGSLERIWSNT